MDTTIFFETDDDDGENHDRGVYSIAVAAELAGLGEQTLRLYESKGLLTPARTAGGTRRYSDNDVLLLRRVVDLLAEGLNLTGARRVLELELVNGQLRSQIAKLTTTLATRSRRSSAVD